MSDPEETEALLNEVREALGEFDDGDTPLPALVYGLVREVHRLRVVLGACGRCCRGSRESDLTAGVSDPLGVG
jgi:hypothetical protein